MITLGLVFAKEMVIHLAVTEIIMHDLNCQNVYPIIQ